MDPRIRAQFIFGEYLNNTDSIIELESLISDSVQNYCSKFPLENSNDLYTRTVYNTIHKIGNGIPIDQIKADLSSLRIGWNTFAYDSARSEIDEEDDFLENPFTVEAGALTCTKCGSNKVFSYSKQTRAGDESTSTFACCTICRNKWVYSG